MLLLAPRLPTPKETNPALDTFLSTLMYRE
jgi:hypothetical protein